jgi:glycine hydroxymethyltransferase
MIMNKLSQSDPEIHQAILGETERIERGVELIPSENFVSRAVMEAMSSVFTNKYSEGYPVRRYYGGQEFVDVVERLAIERAKTLFGAEHVNVQPYSGSPANQAVFMALLDLGDRFMGVDLGCGGHLTHGSPVSFSGINYRAIPYFTDRETGLIDMDHVREVALRERPKMIISSLTAYPRDLDFEAFQEICEEVEAYHVSDISHIAGLIVGGEHPSPVPHADVVTSTTHKSLRGPRGAIIMCRMEDRLHDKYHGDTGKDLRRLIDSAVFPGLQGGPHDHVTATKAVAFGEALRPEFGDYARRVVRNARAMAEELMAHGVKLVTDGTDNHLMVIDLRPKGLLGKGKAVEQALDRAGITLNKNAVPYDEASPFNPSGLRLGTPAVTTRGMREGDVRVIARCVARVIDDFRDKGTLEKVRREISELTEDFPIYPGLCSL